MLRQDLIVRQALTIIRRSDLGDTIVYLYLIDGQERLVGVVDVGVLTGEVFDSAVRERTNEVFEIIGFRLSQVWGASPARAFRYRSPWLGATISSGLFCAP